VLPKGAYATTVLANVFAVQTRDAGEAREVESVSEDS